MSRTCGSRMVVLLLILCCCRGTDGQLTTSVAGQDQPVSDNLRASSDRQKGEAESVPRERIHPDVYTKLKQSDDGRVYVSIMFKPEGFAPAKSDRNKAFIKGAQDAILASLEPSEFELGYRYETVPMLAGHIKNEALVKLSTDPQVQSLSPSKTRPKVHERLRDRKDSRIYVIIRLRPAEREGSSKEETFNALKRIQDRVLKRFAPGEFQLFYRYDSSPTITGMITPDGLARVENDPGVVHIRLDAPIKLGGNGSGRR